MSPKDQKSLERMIGIWQERRVFASDIIQSLRKATTSARSGSSGSGGAGNTRSLMTTHSNNSSSSSTSSGNFDKRSASAFSIPMSPPSPASMSGGANDSAASSLPSEFTNKAVFKALQALVDVEIENNQNRYTLKNNEQLIQEFNTVMAGASDESTLEAMDLPQLQQLQYQYDGILRKFADVKTGFSRENSARKKYIAILKKELEKEQRAFQENDKAIREWTRNVASLQQFQTNIEVRIKQYQMILLSFRGENVSRLPLLFLMGYLVMDQWIPYLRTMSILEFIPRLDLSPFSLLCKLRSQHYPNTNHPS